MREAPRRPRRCGVLADQRLDLRHGHVEEDGHRLPPPRVAGKSLLIGQIALVGLVA